MGQQAENESEKVSSQLKNIVQLGQDMRRLQVKYFKTRDREVLQQSKAAERAFDKAILEIDQPPLF